jgi:hypothetical protein
MKNIVISIFLLVSVLASYAQSNCNIKKAYAFYTISVPGVQMADENGNPIPPKVDIGRFIYVECSGTRKPVIEKVLYDNKILSATLTAVKGNSVIPGSELSKNNDLKITAKKGNRLWKVELQTAGTDSMPEQDCKNIVIKYNVKGKASILKLLKETRLMTMPRY